MRSRKIFVSLLAMVMVLACGMTSMAAYKTRNSSTDYITAALEQIGPCDVRARTTTKGKDGEVRVYVSVAMEYMSNYGNLYSTSRDTVTGTDEVYGSRSASGSFVSAWSDHGRFGRDISLYM